MAAVIEGKRIVHEGGTKLPEIELSDLENLCIIFVVCTVPDEGIGGAGASTFAKTLRKKLGLPKKSYVYLGGISRDAALHYFRTYEPTRLIASNGKLTEDLYQEFNEIHRKEHLQDRDVDRAAAVLSLAALDALANQGKFPIAIDDAKAGAFLLPPFLEKQLEEEEKSGKARDRNIKVITIGVDTNQKTAVERRYQQEMKDYEKALRKWNKNPGKTDETKPVMPTREKVRAVRIKRLVSDNERLIPIYPEYIQELSKKSVRKKSNKTIDSTEATPEQQVMALIHEIATERPVLGSILLQMIAEEEKRVQKLNREKRAREKIALTLKSKLQPVSLPENSPLLNGLPKLGGADFAPNRD